MPIDVIVSDCGLCTALGPDAGTSWEGLLSGRCAIGVNPRLRDRLPDVTWPSAVCAGVGYDSESLVIQMLAPLLAPLEGRFPPDSLLLLATTVGEIDLLEGALISGDTDTGVGRLDGLLRAVSGMLGLSRQGCIVSCACASSSMALAVGGSLIRSGREKDVVVVGCDAVTEFVLAGFVSLAALSPEPARPFDRQRQGLSLGEAAGWCWLTAGIVAAVRDRGPASRRPATEGGSAARGRLLGWSCRADGHHMTAPAPQGEGLSDAIEGALRMAGLSARELGAICAHGTGTRYNDEMEVKAFARALAPAALCPLFSVKGHIGHTLGAAGLIEALFSLEASRGGRVPPTEGCLEPEPEGTPVTRETTRIAASTILSTNSGFGGVNTALVLDGSLGRRQGDPVVAAAVRSGGTLGGPADRDVGRYKLGSADRDVGRYRGNSAGSRGMAGLSLAGLAWVSGDEMGVAAAGRSTRSPLPSMDNPDLFFEGGYKNWGRVAPQSRRLACALELGFRELRLGAGAGHPSSWGILGLNATGCHDENVAFFKDYLEHGRALARGALFVQTLPSTPVAEASIHFGLRGPVCHFVDPELDFTRLVDWGCAIMESGEAAGLVLAALEAEMVLCAFFRAAGPAEADGGMGWAADVVRALPHARPREWMVHFCGAAQGMEGRS